MKKYRLFGKIPVFDLVVILVVVLSAVVCYKVFFSGNSKDVVTVTEMKTIKYTVEFSNLSNLIDGIPELGEVVYDKNTNFEVGKVVYSETEPAVVYAMNELTGESVKTVYDDRQTIRIVVEAIANVSDISTTVNDVRLGIGRTLTLNMPSLCASGVVKNIEIVED